MNVPNSVCWNITQRCNDKCLFCYRDRESVDLELGKQKEVIDKIAFTGIRKLTFAGGEPLLVPEIRTLIQYAVDKGLLVSMTTNGILLEDEWLEFCLQHLDWLSLSLDGSNDEVQGQMTRNPNHVKRVVEILERVAAKKTRKCKIKINTVVSSINKSNIVEIAEIIKKYPVERWKLFQFVPLRGSAKENSSRFWIDDDEFNQIAAKTKECLHEKNGVLVVSNRYSIESSYFVIFPNGDIKISNDLEDKVLGNVLDDNLQEIWMRGMYSKELHEERTGFVKKEREK